MENLNTNKIISVKKIYDLINNYGYDKVYGIFYDIFKHLSEEDIINNYFNVYMTLQLKKMEINDNTYFALVEKYGDEKVEKYFNELFSLNNKIINDKIIPIMNCINDESIFNDENKLEKEEYVDSSINPKDQYFDYLKSIGDIELLTSEEVVLLFKKIDYCVNNINIATIDINNGRTNFNDLYSILCSINSKELKSKLYKIYSHLINNPEQSIIVSKFFSLWKEHSKNNSLITKDEIKELFNYDLGDCELIDNQLLNNQFDLIIEYYQAREELITRNLKLPASISKRYRNSNVNDMDLIQEGNIGLMKTITKFDVSREIKLSTYATWWIKQTILRHIEDTGSCIRIPIHAQEVMKRVLSTQKKLQITLGYEPSYEEIAGALKISPAQVKSSFEFYSLQNICCLDAHVKGENDDVNTTLVDFIPDDRDGVEDIVMKNVLMTEVAKILDEFTPREKDILCYRYGLLNHDVKNLEEIGNIYGITRERVRQIEAKTFRRLEKSKRLREL